MASAAQVLANQANAQLSTGPRTADGKARTDERELRQEQGPQHEKQKEQAAAACSGRATGRSCRRPG